MSGHAAHLGEAPSLLRADLILGRDNTLTLGRVDVEGVTRPWDPAPELSFYDRFGGTVWTGVASLSDGDTTATWVIPQALVDRCRRVRLDAGGFLMQGSVTVWSHMNPGRRSRLTNGGVVRIISGPEGPEGPEGPAGPEGPPGPAGAGSATLERITEAATIGGRLLVIYPKLFWDHL